MAEVTPINPLDQITSWAPIPEEALKVSTWFETEYLDIRAGDTREEFLPWFLAQGWNLYEETTEPTATIYTWRWLDGIAPPRDMEYPAYKDIGSEIHQVTVVHKLGGTTTFRGQWQTRTEQRKLYRLHRRKMQSERVLQDMINEFTKAYNEGRMLNNRRYDEIVALYDVMLDRTESESNTLTDDYGKYDGLVDGIIDNLPTDADGYADEVGALLDGYGQSQRDQINLRFDNEEASARQSLVSRGMFNSTIWEGITAGIARQRSFALGEHEDKLIAQRLAALDRIQRIRMELSQRIVDAAIRLAELKKARRFDVTDFRNKILTAMLAFMERRSDEYPGVGELAQIAASLGYAEGGSVAPPTGA